jgi:hypothetical protein
MGLLWRSWEAETASFGTETPEPVWPQDGGVRGCPGPEPVYPVLVFESVGL